MQSKLKQGRRVQKKNKDLDDMENFLENKGISVNKDSLKTRVKNRKSIGQLEQNQEKLQKKLMDQDDSDSDEDMVDESERVGRKRKRSTHSKDEDEVLKESGKRGLTPIQLKSRS